MINKLQRIMSELPQVDCPIVDHFSDGVYARELVIPEGVCIVGSRHKTNHLLIILKGVCAIADNRNPSEVCYGPMVLETKAGTKRAITAITETRMLTVHITDETDIAKIGDKILEPEPVLPQWKKKALEAI